MQVLSENEFYYEILRFLRQIDRLGQLTHLRHQNHLRPFRAT